MLFPLFDTIPHRRTPFVTIGIIVACIAAMFWEAKLPQPQIEEVIARRGFVPARIAQLSKPNQVVQVVFPRPPMVHPRFRHVAFQPNPRVIALQADRSEILISLITMMFLHGGWLHLGSNMWFLWIFGNNIEDRLGHFVFLAFYLIGGLLAAACHWVTGPDSVIPVVGASGAVAAVLGAYAITFPTAGVRTLLFLGIFITLIDLPALVVLGFWFVLQLASATGWLPMGMEQSVAFWAHVGGFAAGLALMPIFSLAAPPPGDDWHTEAKKMFEFDEPGRDDTF